MRRIGGVWGHSGALGRDFGGILGPKWAQKGVLIGENGWVAVSGCMWGGLGWTVGVGTCCGCGLGWMRRIGGVWSQFGGFGSDFGGILGPKWAQTGVRIGLNGWVVGSGCI